MKHAASFHHATPLECLPSHEDMHRALEERHGKNQQACFDAATIGIAGLGGLGSHVALSLTRLGIGHLILVDCDTVEITNIHRQHYRSSDIGTPKALALTQQLQEINPYLTFEPHVMRLTPTNTERIFSSCTLIIEALDDPEEKAWFTQTCLSRLPHITLIGASGMAGSGTATTITTIHPFAHYYLCGDGISDVASCQTLMAPRVSVCANHMASAAMRLILGLDPIQDSPLES